MRNLTPWEFIMEKRRFTLFPKLPMEMRDTIWRLTLEPRLVEVRPKYEHRDEFYSTAPLPIVMTVCKDSERAVQSLYPQCFGGWLGPAKIRFNFNIDTLYLDWKIQEHLVPFLLSISLQEAEKIQFLALDQYLRWARQQIDFDYTWSQTPVYNESLTIFDLQTKKFRRSYHTIINHNECKIHPVNLGQLCSAVDRMKNLKELIFVYADVIWDPELLKRDGVPPHQDELAGLTLFQREEVCDLFPAPVEMIDLDYRYSIDDSHEDMPVDNLQDDLDAQFDSPNFEVLIRYGWRFPDSLTYSPRLTEPRSYGSCLHNSDCPFCLPRVF
ncbi:hypothetical protein BOTCAL_0367g00040 [Botryotinia calthae]|uniref:2EXR domain-containing protein n=1 Tax=Botryotinia calthae TaxID=38488 RepID=A0A4Y8CS22_9HELO|nr:hypothetical protein BOTCAL_0367g00040 [Botryotinia calthae]